jgi:hypothetical protein
MVFIDLLSEMEITHIAPWRKRILSSIVDIFIIYGLYGILCMVIPLCPSNGLVTVIFGFYYFIIIPSRMNVTIGDMILKLQPIFVVEKTNKKILYFLRGLYQSIIITFPLISVVGFLFLSGIIVIVTIVLNKKNIIKKNKLLIWDVLSQMVVVEKTSAPFRKF